MKKSAFQPCNNQRLLHIAIIIVIIITLVPNLYVHVYRPVPVVIPLSTNNYRQLGRCSGIGPRSWHPAALDVAREREALPPFHGHQSLPFTALWSSLPWIGSQTVSVP